MVERQFLDLLGRHVGGRADAGDLGALGAVDQRGAEVGNLDLAPAGVVAGKQDVGRLDVAVGDAAAVGKVERTRALEDDLDDAFRREQRLRVAAGFEGSAGNVFHDDVAQFLGDHRVVDLYDVRMNEAADQRRFVHEQVGVERAAFSVAQGGGRGDLDRHVALREGVVPEIDGGGGAAADFMDQRVFADLVHGAPGVR